MKVIKLDIKEELLDIPNDKPYIDFVKYSDLSVVMLEKSSPENYSVEGKRERYEVREYYNNINGKKNFLIKVEDKEIFNLLAQFTQDDFEKFEKKCYFDFMSYKAPIIRHDVRESIKSLKWWKRLFNKF